jgi:ABC-2 type transport system ATP-binding protein
VSQRVVEVHGLRKRYGELEAVRGVDLHVERGEVFALLGPNGAGKTTIVEILEGFRPRTEGEVRVLGHDPAAGETALKERVGIVLQSTGVDPFLTVRETVELYRAAYPRPRAVADVIEIVGLVEKAGTRVGRLSGGQRRRLDVAVALAGDPDLLFLDEPTTGFDPAARRSAWELVRGLAAVGTTVFLTTHLMDEAQALADRVAVITRGEIVAEGPPATLGGRDRMLARIRYRLPDGVPAVPAWGQETLPDGSFLLRAEDPTEMAHEVTGWALDRGFSFEVFEVTQPSLEDVYLDLTGGEGSEA